MSQNKTIFINTIFLYFRMLLILAVSLYTTRIVYNALGIENFGIFNLVAGFILLFSFLSAAMRSGIQRYINIAIPNGIKAVNEVFSAAFSCQALVAILFIFFTQTIGLWVLNFKLNIPVEKIKIANIVFQLSIFSSLFNILVIPYQALILAKEKMSIYAYIGILEVFSKLFIAYALFSNIKIDVLVLYSVLLFILSIVVDFIYYFYVVNSFKLETKYKKSINIDLLKDIFLFSSWNILGQLFLIGSRQGVAVIFNIFYGIKINASIAIANQINALVFNFFSNLQTAFNPQIVQSFAKNDIERHRSLTLNASRYSLFLLLIIATPFLLFTNELLVFWLGGDLPKYILDFTVIVVVVSLIEAASGPFWMSAHAIGNIKYYQLVISSILLLTLPLTYILLSSSFSVVFVFSINILISTLIYIYRIFYFFNKIGINKEKFYFYLKDIILVFLLIFFMIFFMNLKVNKLFYFLIYLFIYFRNFCINVLNNFCVRKHELNAIKSILKTMRY